MCSCMYTCALGDAYVYWGPCPYKVEQVIFYNNSLYKLIEVNRAKNLIVKTKGHQRPPLLALESALALLPCAAAFTRASCASWRFT